MEHKKYLHGILFSLIIILIFFNNFSNFFTIDYTPFSKISVHKELNSNSGDKIIQLPLKLFLSEISLIHFYFWILIILIVFLLTSNIIKSNISSFSIFLILIFNPFTYLRIISGQLGIVVSFFLMPVFLHYLKQFLDDINLKSTLTLALVYSIVSSFQIHFYVINMIIFFVALMWFFKKELVKDYKKYLTIFFIAILFLNIYWIQGFFGGNITSQIDESHVDFFSPKQVSGVSTVARIVGMWGFWRESAYITTYSTLPLVLWYALTFMFVVLMLIGYNYKKDKISKFFLSLWTIGFILSFGISHKVLAPFFNFLFNYMPFFSGFRDSHKFVALMVLAYAYLIPQGINYIKEKLTNKFSKYAINVLFILLIILYTYPLIGLWGQVKSVEYPDSYKETNEFMNELNIEGNVIYLPWQTYLTYIWSQDVSSDGRIANPINKVIEHNIYTGSDRYGYTTRYQEQINHCLILNSKECLKESSVQYVMHDSCAFFNDEYKWIEQDPIFTNNCISIYELDEFTQPEPKPFPFGFVLSSIISFTTLIIMVYSLRKKEH
jgi:hypothetical protein